MLVRPPNTGAGTQPAIGQSTGGASGGN